MDNFYEKKYLKYKIKFLKLKQIGGFIISWPEDTINIKNLIDQGIINYKIISIGRNLSSSSELNKQTSEKLPGLMGKIIHIDENKLIMSELKDNNDIIKVDRIKYNKQNTFQVKLEPYIKNGDKLEPYINIGKDMKSYINSVENYCNNFIKYHTQDGKMSKKDYDELIGRSTDLRMSLQEIKDCINKKNISIISTNGTPIPKRELGIGVPKPTSPVAAPVAAPIVIPKQTSPVADVPKPTSSVADVPKPTSSVADVSKPTSPVPTLDTLNITALNPTSHNLEYVSTVAKPDYTLEIKTLEERLKKLENKFNNHYHDIPTTGVREFDVQHPFYKNP